ncbi:hypothetical protein BDV33DRAFT_47532 [Aspergillus novoparasiticus]|uniref:Uncharacterized protein n=1 Tax=Aspergillus novoparasiticus TaxID=986946 RepID=A0A5N6F0A7_9EURO|nr:hypothetical protein BDV33DRAFT_47532 [Aspergillus novoparasiticus]
MVSHELYLALWNALNSIATTSFILQSRQLGTGLFQYHGHCIPSRAMVSEVYLWFTRHLVVLALQIASFLSLYCSMGFNVAKGTQEYEMN